jgi:hypothetical protein
MGVTSQLAEIRALCVENDEYIFLITQAQKCRMLAKGVSARDVAATLRGMAKDYEERAATALAKQSGPSALPTIRLSPFKSKSAAEDPDRLPDAIAPA